MHHVEVSRMIHEDDEFPHAGYMKWMTTWLVLGSLLPSRNSHITKLETQALDSQR